MEMADISRGKKRRVSEGSATVNEGAKKKEKGGGSSTKVDQRQSRDWIWLAERGVRFGRRQQSLFDQQGYIIMPRLLSERGVRYLRDKVRAIHAGRHESVDDEWILNLHQVLPPDDNWMWALATHPLLVDMVESSLGKDVQLYASDGNERGRTIWICLDSVGPGNGGLVVLPGWHKKGRIPLKLVESVEELAPAQYFASHNVFAVDLSAANIMPPTQGVAGLESPFRYMIPRGGAGMHHPLLPHSSPPNASSSRDRRVIILRYMAAGEPVERARVRHWRTGEMFDKEVFTVERGTAPPRPCCGM